MIDPFKASLEQVRKTALALGFAPWTDEDFCAEFWRDDWLVRLSGDLASAPAVDLDLVHRHPLQEETVYSLWVLMTAVVGNMNPDAVDLRLSSQLAFLAEHLPKIIADESRYRALYERAQRSL